MCVTVTQTKTERKRQNRSVYRAEKPHLRTGMTQLRGLICPTPGVLATADALRNTKHLIRWQFQAKLMCKRQATWGMSVKVWGVSMNILLRLQRAVAILSIITFSATTGSAVQAATYNYTGANYAVAFTPLTNAMSIAGSFEVANPLSASMALTDISSSLTSYSFFNGVQNFTTGGTVSAFNIATDAAGEILDWNININICGSP